MFGFDLPRWLGLVLAVGLGAGCASTDASRPPAIQDERAAPSLRETVRQLTATFPGVQVEWDEALGRVRRLRGLPAKRLANAEQIVRSVLSAPTVAAALGLSGDLRELCRPVTQRDPQLADAAVVRMHQCLDGVRVLGAELVVFVRLGSEPVVDTITTSLSPARPRTLRPAISPAEATEAARRARAARQPDAAREPLPAEAAPPPELVVFDPTLYQEQGPARLCWLVRLGSLEVLIDAGDAGVVKLYSNLQRGAP